jgi:hypothetical protein
LTINKKCDIIVLSKGTDNKHNTLFTIKEENNMEKDNKQYISIECGDTAKEIFVKELKDLITENTHLVGGVECNLLLLNEISVADCDRVLAALDKVDDEDKKHDWEYAYYVIRFDDNTKLEYELYNKQGKCIKYNHC